MTRRFRKLDMGCHKTNLDSVYFETQRQMCTITKRISFTGANDKIIFKTEIMLGVLWKFV